MALAETTVDQPSRIGRFWERVSIVFESRIGATGLAIVLLWFAAGLLSLFWRRPYSIHWARTTWAAICSRA